MSNILNALCCVCGNLRTCRRPRNHKAENYWFAGPIDRNWHRETGDLKCSECGRITTHAIIHPEKDSFRDHAEMMQRVATGNSHGHFNAAQLEEVATKYRQGLPRNPYLVHYWYKNVAQEDWDAGRCTTKALCGEKITLHRDPSGPSSGKRRGDDRQIKPADARDQEYEDSETGLSWIEADCVDCLRVWHLELLRQRREDLVEKMTEFLRDLLADKSGYPKKIDLRTVDLLIEVLESVRQPDPVKTEGMPR
ncbi:hypothetical protein [Mycobacterium sp. ZZG]